MAFVTDINFDLTAQEGAPSVATEDFEHGTAVEIATPHARLYLIGSPDVLRGIAREILAQVE